MLLDATMAGENFTIAQISPRPPRTPGACATGDMILSNRSVARKLAMPVRTRVCYNGGDYV